MSLASAASTLGWAKSDRHWCGYGIGTHYKDARKAFARARRYDARRVCELELADWKCEDDRMMSGDVFSEWVMGLDEDNMSHCGSLWCNDGQVDYHRDYMTLEATTKADRMIDLYAVYDAEQEASWYDDHDDPWYGDHDDPWYDDPWYDYNDPRESIALAFDEMERMQDEPDQDDSDVEIDWRESLEDERDEWEDMLASLVPFHRERDVFGHVLSTDETLTEWHNRKVG